MAAGGRMGIMRHVTLGRPRSVMTPEVIEAILRAVEQGLPVDRAAYACGVEPSTVRSHRERNPSFGTSLEKAQAISMEHMVRRITSASEKQWQAAAWILERRFPSEWARREEGNKPVTAEEMRDAMLAAAKAIAESGGA